MALNLSSVEGYVNDVRGLLLDKVQPYRYTDADVLVAFNLALQAGRRLRPDLFICNYGIKVPQYEAVTGEEVPIEAQFREAFVFGIASHVLLRDQEDVQDARADTFKKRFEDILIGDRQTAIRGGTPTPNDRGGQ